MASSSASREKGRFPGDEMLPQFQTASSPPSYSEANAYPTVRSRHLFSSTVVYYLRFGIFLLLPLSLYLLLLTSREDLGVHDPRPLPAAKFEASLAKCAALRTFPIQIDPAERTVNPRWNPVSGQDGTTILRNATLFDGERFLTQLVDIVFRKGLIVSVSPTGTQNWNADADYDLHGQYVTPGLVDMHSHHLVEFWPNLPAVSDGNEVHTDFGPLTPFVRAVDGMKAYDEATALIASGGVTTSLIIPGSANIMGGEGATVKNRMRSGKNGEYVVEELLLEHGIPFEERNRYIKLACGENPKDVYGHNRMGNAYILRHHLARAKQLLEKQDSWCAAAEQVAENSGVTAAQHRFMERAGGFPEELELDSTVGLLRGRVAMHNHCYEPEDIEVMMRISHEFGFTIRAFHHALAAWQVPEMLKAYSENITIATFAEFGLYKVEAYAANLYAGKILNDHGVNLAYKSDHATGTTNAKYLLSQAAIAHSFHVPADVALRAVTSVPAKSIYLDHRVGYARVGYDADLVVWDSHPLSIGATPRQVFVDGVATLDPAKVKETMDDQVFKSSSSISSPREPATRVTVAEEVKKDVCAKASKKGQNFVIQGIQRSFLENYADYVHLTSSTESESANLTLVVSGGQVACLGTHEDCKKQVIAASADSEVVSMNLSNGYLAPGLTAVSTELGMIEIAMEEQTGDGKINPFLDPKNPANIDHAKYGVNLDGKAFVRARLGGVTRAVTPPLTDGGLIRGVSVGFLTSGKRKLVNGGIVKDDVALHVNLGDADRTSPGAISFAIQELRSLLKLGIDAAAAGQKDGNVYAQVAEGSLPLVIHASSEHDIQQVILLKRDLSAKGAPKLKVIIHGGHGAHYVAKELAYAKIPVILTANRGAYELWEFKDALPGPPLTRSAASILAEAGVEFAIALLGEPPESDSRIHDLALEASWAAKYAKLNDRQAVQLVSRKVEDILGLHPSRDIVVWEGSPLQFGTPIFTFQAVPTSDKDDEVELELAACWPDESDYGL